MRLNGLKPLIRSDIDDFWKIGDYLEALMNMFKNHNWLKCYANYLDVNILNCTKNSMIDSYSRKK